MIYGKSLEMKKKKKNKKKYAEEIKANFIVKSNIRKIQDVNADISEIVNELRAIRREIDGGSR